jgi:hypothetical protein
MSEQNSAEREKQRELRAQLAKDYSDYLDRKGLYVGPVSMNGFQASVERDEAGDFVKYDDAIMALMYERDLSASKDAEIARLREENELLKAQVINDAEANTAIRAERDALRAQLDAPQRQEPLTGERLWRMYTGPSRYEHGEWTEAEDDHADWNRLADSVSKLYASPVHARVVMPETSENPIGRYEVALAYGFLWHVNNDSAAPTLMYSPYKAASKARILLREQLTREERGKAINEAGIEIGRYPSDARLNGLNTKGDV